MTYNPYIERLNKDLREHNYPPAILIRVIFISYLRYSFYGRRLGDLKWNENDENSEVLIRDYLNEEEAVKEKRPVIALSRGPIIPMDATLYNNLVRMNVNTDQSWHKDLLNTSMSFRCVSNDLIESEYLGSIVFHLLQYFRDDIRAYGIDFIRNFRLSETVPKNYGAATEARSEMFETIASCNISVVNAWTKRWKTVKEMDEYQERTGLDIDRTKLPPKTIEGYDIIPEY